MDRLGIERAYLSISSPGVHFGDDVEARALARRVNEWNDATARRRGDRITFQTRGITPRQDRHL
jgi:hypothetical protein